MRLFVDERFWQERSTFSLKSTCEHCVHFDDAAQSCSLEYPTAPHRQDAQDALNLGDILLFCKTFEMG